MDQFAELSRERKRVRTRARIEQMALALFAEHGFDATTVGRRCAIGERMFFSYFAGTDDVALSDIADEPEGLADLVATKDPELSVLGMLRAAARGRRSAQRERSRLAPVAAGVESVAFSFDDPGSRPATSASIHSMFLMRPPRHNTRMPGASVLCRTLRGGGSSIRCRSAHLVRSGPGTCGSGRAVGAE